MTFELAKPEDFPAIKALSLQVHHLHVSWRPDIFRPDREPYPQEKFLQDIRNRMVYVARLEGMVAGYVTLALLSKSGPGVVAQKLLRLDSICVEEAIRGQGLGREMVADCRALARAFGCRGLILGVHPENDRAVAFYQKCGFRIRSINMDMYL